MKEIFFAYTVGLHGSKLGVLLLFNFWVKIM